MTNLIQLFKLSAVDHVKWLQRAELRKRKPYYAKMGLEKLVNDINEYLEEK